MMNPLKKQWFFKGFYKELRSVMTFREADAIWQEAGEEYTRLMREMPQLKKHPGAMVIPAVCLYKALANHGKDTEMLKAYGTEQGIRFAKAVHALTSIPGVDKLIWNNAEKLGDRMSSEKLGYKRRLVSDPPLMYGVDILSCPYHELAKQLDAEKAVLCICCMDKEYSKGFRHIRYVRNGSVAEGAECGAYRLSFDPEKE